MKKLHILMATTGFYPATAWGGPVTVVYQNALELQRRGHKVTVATSNLLNKKDRIAPGYFQQQTDGLEVHYLPMYNIKQWPGTLGPTMLSIKAKKILRSLIQDADIVHVNAVRNSISIQAGSLAFDLDKPFVIQPHGSTDIIMNTLLLKKLHNKFVLRKFLQRATAILALQPTEVQQIILAGGFKNQIYIIPNGFPDNRVRSKHKRNNLRNRLEISPDAKVILSLGRINYKKGPDLLVKAFSSIPDNVRSDMVLMIVGPDDGQLSEVRELITQHNLESHVRLPGLLTGDDVWMAYQTADLFVLPCRVDTFPMAIVEACQARLPMVITDACEIANLLDEKVARIVSVDVEAIAQGITHVLSNPDLSAKYKKGANELMKTTFSIKAVGDQLEKLYRQALSDKKHAH